MTDWRERERERFCQLFLAAKLQTRLDLDHPPLTTRLVHGGIEQIRWWNDSRLARSSRSAGADHCLSVRITFSWIP